MDRKIVKEDIKMELKTLFNEDIEREHSYLLEQEVGSDEYIDSLKRLGDLEVKLFDLTKFESECTAREQQLKDEKKDRMIKNGIEIGKTVGGWTFAGVMAVAIMAFEKEDTFTSALKGCISCFIPKKIV